MKQTCIFCKIINKEIPAKFLHETDQVIVIQDIFPKAPIHYLIIPKKHVENVIAVDHDDLPIFANLFAAAQHIAKENGISDFRLVTNNGKNAGQSVFHLHLHFLAGKQMFDL